MRERETEKEGRWQGDEREGRRRVTDIVMKASSCHLPSTPVLLAHHACTASLFGPRPVQDAARIAREGPAGEKKESNPYEISSPAASFETAALILFATAARAV